MASQASTDSTRYTGVAIFLHWVIALGVIANIGLAELTEDFSREVRGPYMDVHKAIGISILFLTLFRLYWRLTHKAPPLPPLPGWQVTVFKIVQILFYVLLIGLPLGGWLWMSTYPAPVSFFGLFNVPLWPVAGNEALGDVLHEGHEIGGKIMLALVVLHIAAAFYHLFKKDGVFRQMWPGGAS